jgi:Xaa-Pro dipeptidase
MGVDWESRIDFARLRKERLKRAKDALGKSTADVLFVFRAEDVRYLTGFRCHMGPAPWVGMAIAAAVLPKGGDPYLFTMDWEFCRAKMDWIQEDHIIGGGFLLTDSGAREWAKQVQSLLGDLSGKTIGVDLWTPVIEERLKAAFPKAIFIDGYDKILTQAKMIKTQDELECMRAAYALSEAGMSAGLRFLRTGVRECEVLGVIWQTMTALGSEWSQCANIVCSGPYTAPYRRFTSDRIIREGDLVVIDIGGCFNGYWGDFTRTVICGDLHPTPEQKALYQEDYDTLFAACEASRAGNSIQDVMRQMQNEHSGGLSDGHGAGIHPWEEPWFVLDDDYPFTLRAGMGLSIEPYAGIPGIGGIRLENQLFVTDREPEIYSTFPFDQRFLDHIHPLDKTTGRGRPQPS